MFLDLNIENIFLQELKFNVIHFKQFFFSIHFKCFLEKRTLYDFFIKINVIIFIFQGEEKMHYAKDIIVEN